MDNPNISASTLSLDKIEEEENNDSTVIEEENFEAIFDKIRNLSHCMSLNTMGTNYKICLNLNNGMELRFFKEEVSHRSNGWFKKKDKKFIQNVTLYWGSGVSRREINIKSTRALNQIFKVWQGQEKALGLL